MQYRYCVYRLFSIWWFIIWLLAASIYTPMVNDSLKSISGLACKWLQLKFELARFIDYVSSVSLFNLCIRQIWLGRIG